MTTLNSRLTVDNHAEVLRLARAALATAQEQRDRCAKAWERRDPPVEYDPGMTSGIRRRTTASQAKRETASQNKDFDTYRELRQAEDRLKSAQARVDSLVARTPVPFTDAELAAATAVRDDLGWHRPLKVNRVTVQVEGFPWPHTIRRCHILEVRRLESADPAVTS